MAAEIEKSDQEEDEEGDAGGGGGDPDIVDVSFVLVFFIEGFAFGCFAGDGLDDLFQAALAKDGHDGVVECFVDFGLDFILADGGDDAFAVRADFGGGVAWKLALAMGADEGDGFGFFKGVARGLGFVGS